MVNGDLTVDMRFGWGWKDVGEMGAAFPQDFPSVTVGIPGKVWGGSAHVCYLGDVGTRVWRWFFLVTL